MENYPQQEDDMRDISVKEALSILKENTADYIAARRELLQIEAKEASQVLGKKLAMAVVLVVGCVFSYILFWGVVIALGGYLYAHLAGGCPCWGAVLSGIAVLLLHVIVAVVLVKKLKRKPDFELFGMTKAEFRRDKEWLEENN